MKSIQNLLEFLNNNWTSILVCIGLIVGIIKQTVNYFSKSDDEKIEIAKTQIQETILRMITDAEIDYEEWASAGSIKRSQVIEEIYDTYPILSKVIDQESLIEWIDEQIDNALVTLREIIELNIDIEEDDSEIDKDGEDEIENDSKSIDINNAVDEPAVI